MKTSIIGYPRVGSFRELKFATERYFKNEITAEELEETAKQLRKAQWIALKQSGLDLIPSNDFSLYDTVLDTAVLFNIIPKRYIGLGLSPLDTYFAMARGYQGSHGDVKALAMKKWFNTNYHYMVPEIDDDTEIKLVGKKPFHECKEAREYDVTTKSVILGPFTLLKLLRYTGKNTMHEYVEAIIQAYGELLLTFDSIDLEWLQFDEPSLVCDLTDADKALFVTLYRGILAYKGRINVLLQTYFGDIRDIYSDVITLEFDAIGLDFIEGKKTLNLIQENGFPKDKLLFAGLVNGKNIWRNDYKKSLSVLSKLKQNGISIVLNSSCSLQHVPYTLKNEEKLDFKYRKHLSFAQEKLKELQQIKELSELDTIYENQVYIHNQKLFEDRINCFDNEVQKRIADIKDVDFIRSPKLEEREVIQKDMLKLPKFPTTTIGSFPQTADVKANRMAFKKGKISKEEYTLYIRNKIKECIALQEDIHLDVLVHGEYERNDMVEYFGELLNGYIFSQNGWVQSYGTRCVKPPIIWGDISRSEPMSVAYAVYAQGLSDKPVKGMLTGPVTILNWSFPREDISLKDSAYQIALAIRDEVLDLEKNGINIIQVDEAALREKLPLRQSDWQSEYLDWAIPAFRLVHSGVNPNTQIHTHMCYSEFIDIIKAIDDMDADVITFEASRSDLVILNSLKENDFKTQVGPGVYDIHSPRVPTIDEIKGVLLKILDNVDEDRLWINPDCGLKTRGEKETVESLKNMVAATNELRNTYK